MKNALFRIIAIVIGLLSAVLFFEVLLRLGVDKRLKDNFSSFKGGSENETMLSVFNDPHNSFTYRPSSLLGYELVPNSCFDINSYGLMGREYKIKKEADTFRILLLGDSIARHEYASIFLESYLNASPSLKSKHKFEIWNAGVGGYDVRKYAIYLQYKGLRYKPDMVMVYLCLNDFDLDVNVYYKNLGTTQVCRYDNQETSKRYAVSPFLMGHSYVYRLLMLNLESRLSAPKKKTGQDPLVENGNYYLGLIKEICEKNKISLFVVVFPYLKPLDSYTEYQLHQYKSACSVVKGLGLDYLNLYDCIPRDSFYKFREEKEDQIHPGYDGHLFISRQIYNHLANNSLANRIKNN